MVTAGRLWTIAGLAATVLLVGACDRRTPSGKAVSQSARELHTVMSPASSTSSESTSTFAQSKYQEVVKTVSEANKEGLAGEVAAAALLAAESQLGLTEQPVATATSLEAQVDSETLVLRSFLSVWIAENARAEAAALYNPADAIATAEKEAASFDAKAAEMSNRRDQLASRIKDLKSQAGQKLDTVREEEAAISKMKEEAGTLKATEAAKIIEQASSRRREADKVRTEGSLLDAQAEQLQPQFREAELMLEQYQAQAKTYRDSITEMRRQEVAKKEEVSQARGAAQAAAQELDTRLSAIAKTRGEALTQAYDAATSAFQKALSTAKEAKSDQSFALAKVSEGNIQQGLGDLHWARAQGLLRYAATLGRLGEVKPSLPNASTYVDQAKTAKEAAGEALQSAEQAYQAASSAFGSAQVRGAAKEHLALLSSKLEAIAKITSGQGLDVLAALANGTFKPSDAPAPEPAPDAPVEQAPPTPVDTTDGAGAFLDSLLNAVRAGDAATIAASLSTDNEQLRGLATEQIKLLGNLARVEAACMEKFNESFVGGMTAMAQQTGQSSQLDAASLAKLADLKSGDLNIQVQGDSGTFSFPGFSQSGSLTKVDGQWKIGIPAEILAVPEQQRQMGLTILVMMNNVMPSVADDINAGTIDSVQSAIMALQTKIMSSGPGLGNGGGGGG